MTNWCFNPVVTTSFACWTEKFVVDTVSESSIKPSYREQQQVGAR